MIKKYSVINLCKYLKLTSETPGSCHWFTCYHVACGESFTWWAGFKFQGLEFVEKPLVHVGSFYVVCAVVFSRNWRPWSPTKWSYAYLRSEDSCLWFVLLFFSIGKIIFCKLWGFFVGFVRPWKPYRFHVFIDHFARTSYIFMSMFLLLSSIQ